MSFPSSFHTKKMHRQGTHRVLGLEDTYRCIQPLMPRLGITRLANVTGLDVLNVPVFAAHRPNARSLSVAFGKGLTDTAARVSALMEALEAHHAEHLKLPLLRMSQEEVCQNHACLDVHGLPRLSVSAYRNDLPMLWAEGTDIANQCSKWLPYEMVHTDFRLPLPCGSGAFAMSSNGLASGNHLMEATLHGLCELVERDATTLWHTLSHDAQAATRLDISSIGNIAQGLIERIEEAGLAVVVWDTTSDVGIPAFLAVLTERQPDPLGGALPHSGMGCHPCRDVAVLRAITEAAQGRLTVISGARDDLTHGEYRRGRVGERERNLVGKVIDGTGLRQMSDVSEFDGDSVEEDLVWALSRLQSAGLREVVVVDLTCESFGVPVVRVVVPGLEFMHDAPGYVPGKRARKRLWSRP